MKIQSISIVVPTKGCINDCKFCVSKMHCSPYVDKFNEIQYRKRIKFAKNNGVNTMILTGTGEVLQNIGFLKKLRVVLEKEHHPFPNVEVQTTGTMLMESFRKSDNTLDRLYPNLELLDDLGVNTISLSVSDVFDSDNNWNIIGAPEKFRHSLVEICNVLKEHGFNIRLSLNMTNVYDGVNPKEILDGCSYLNANQITFRKLYYPSNTTNTEQAEWVRDNACDKSVFTELNGFIEQFGKPLYRLPFGPIAYSIKGMSTVIDDNCMNKDILEKLKYVILRENGKLYCQWDDEGSLLF